MGEIDIKIRLLKMIIKYNKDKSIPIFILKIIRRSLTHQYVRKYSLFVK